MGHTVFKDIHFILFLIFSCIQESLISLAYRCLVRYQHVSFALVSIPRRVGSKGLESNSTLLSVSSWEKGILLNLQLNQWCPAGYDVRQDHDDAWWFKPLRDSPNDYNGGAGGSQSVTCGTAALNLRNQLGSVPRGRNPRPQMAEPTELLCPAARGSRG